MQMTNKEIVRDYEGAKNKRAQLKILAELNACSQMDIARILSDNGIVPPSPWKMFVENKNAVEYPAEEAQAKAEAAEQKPEPIDKSKFFKFEPAEPEEPEEPQKTFEEKVEEIVDKEEAMEEMKKELNEEQEAAVRFVEYDGNEEQIIEEPEMIEEPSKDGSDDEDDPIILQALRYQLNGLAKEVSSIDFKVRELIKRRNKLMNESRKIEDVYYRRVTEAKE